MKTLALLALGAWLGWRWGQDAAFEDIYGVAPMDIEDFAAEIAPLQ